MKNSVSFFLLLSLFGSTQALNGQDWKPAGDKIRTSWSLELDPNAPLPEYPRPQLQRTSWQNLNGLWDYSILPGSATEIPTTVQGKILVPYPIESALSGVGKTVGKEQELWYNKIINIDKAIRKAGRILLHFGAVDWRAEVFVNGKKAGMHEGGYDAFSFDITDLLVKGNKQTLAVRVWDPSDKGPQPRGKQVNKPESIWYTPVTGIWQTVWLEGVPATYIRQTRHTPDIDKSQVEITALIEGSKPGDELNVSVWDKEQKITEQKGPAGTAIVLNLPGAKLWSPDSPALYDLKLEVWRNGKKLDEVSSYFAMRKLSLEKDKQGVQRMMLNNKFQFQYGPLDQGWWPDGLYTAPTDKALLFDIATTKDMGFNMIRKHVKVEPARWYYHCDRLGMLVWQDMPSGDMGLNNWDMRPGEISGRKRESDRSAESEAIYRKEWTEIMDELYNFPSIVVWVPFNEAWGQFKTKEITEWTQQHDPSRLVNSASGGNFFPTGDIIDVHHYPDPLMPAASVFGDKQALVLGEFGGLGLPVEGHTWQQKDNWGYQSFKNNKELEQKYAEFIKALAALVPMGLSAAVYTQTTDVEIETNGLMTYDRKLIKIPVETLKRIHEVLYKQP